MLAGFALLFGGQVMFFALVMNPPTRWWGYYETAARTITVSVGFVVFWLSHRVAFDLLDMIRTRLKTAES